MKPLRSGALLGVGVDIAASTRGCAQAPALLQKQFLLPSHWRWQSSINASSSATGLAATQAVVEYSTRLAQRTFNFVHNKQPFVVIGGDHSTAIGTWSGVSAACRLQGRGFGLIWVDAHMDAHTPETTPSGNIHGMPLAVLLGHGDPRLTHIAGHFVKLDPAFVCVLGARSFETDEPKLLKNLGVRIYEMSEIQQRGWDVVLHEALRRVRQAPAGFGLTVDVDAVDPLQAPGVGTAAPNGLSNANVQELIAAVRADPKCPGIELVEFNPSLDVNGRTEKLMLEWLQQYCR